MYYNGTTTEDNSQGPLTVLPALESATAGWTNVLDQTYTMGVTIFKNNPFTGCSTTECTVNAYMLGSRTAKSRMITIQETNELGCTNESKSCPVWMTNYLNRSTEYGGTVNQTGGDYGNNLGYWTMSANSSTTTNAEHVFFLGGMSGNKVTNSTFGARAVVVIDK